MWRIKTKEEFIKEFGENYISVVQWNPQGNMDYLFGYTLPEDQASVIIKTGRIRNRIGTSIKTHANGDFISDYMWTITSQMITDLPLSSTKRYRVKTEEEFILEFGHRWRDVGHPGWMGKGYEKEYGQGMDVLFGIEITSEEYRAIYNSGTQGFPNKWLLPNGTRTTHTWWLGIHMVKEEDVYPKEHKEHDQQKAEDVSWLEDWYSKQMESQGE